MRLIEFVHVCLQFACMYCWICLRIKIRETGCYCTSSTFMSMPKCRHCADEIFKCIFCAKINVFIQCPEVCWPCFKRTKLLLIRLIACRRTGSRCISDANMDTQFKDLTSLLWLSKNHCSVFNDKECHHIRLHVDMVTSSNGNIFRATGPLCGEFTGPGEFPAQRPVTRSIDAGNRLSHSFIGNVYKNIYLYMYQFDFQPVNLWIIAQTHVKSLVLIFV